MQDVDPFACLRWVAHGSETVVSGAHQGDGPARSPCQYRVSRLPPTCRHVALDRTVANGSPMPFVYRLKWAFVAGWIAARHCSNC